MPAVIDAGLPLSSVPELIEALSLRNPSAIERIPGISMSIISIATTGVKQAYSDAFKVVFLASIPFGVCSMIAAFFFVDIDDRLSHDVVRRLDARGEDVVGEEFIGTKAQFEP